MFVSSASRQKYALEEPSSMRPRGTPEYNPLYDAFQPDILLPPRQSSNEFRPITPPPPRFVPNYVNQAESTYDKPRSYRDNLPEPKPPTNGQRQYRSCSSKKVGERYARTSL